MIQDQTTIESSVRLAKPIPQDDRIDTIVLRIDAIRSENGFGTYVLGVAGCDRFAGVSTIAGNLAVRAAQLGMGPVLLLDGNLAHPRQAVNFGLQQQSGLADYLAGETSPGEVVHSSNVDSLDVLPTGSPKHAENVAIVPELMESLMHELREEYRLIIIDLPPVRSSARSQILSRQTDGLMFVANARETKARNAEAALETLQECGVEVVGSVLNRAQRNLPKWLDRWF